MQDVIGSKDGRRILFAGSNGGDNWQIMQIPVEGGKAEFTGLEVTGKQFLLDLNSDGSRIAFSGTTCNICGSANAPK